MNYEVRVTATFSACLRRLNRKYRQSAADLAKAIKILEQAPESGTAIPGNEQIEVP